MEQRTRWEWPQVGWTKTGGQYYIEASTMKGKGSLTLTGHLGDVMKESAGRLSYIRSEIRRWNQDRCIREV
jgi:ATP-dependent Lon protease